jgi:hypothetical protein
MFVSLPSAPAEAVNAVVGSELFGDEFMGSPDGMTLDATKWSFMTAGTEAQASVLINTNYPRTNVEIYSAGRTSQQPGVPNARISNVSALDFSSMPNDWWAQVVFRFPVQGGRWLAPNASESTARQYNVLTGQDAVSETAQGNNQGFDLRAVRYRNGLWALAWNGIDDTTLRVAEILDDNAGEGYAFSDSQAYAVSMHRKSNDTVDIYFDKTAGDGSMSELVAAKPLLGPAGAANPVGLTIGDWSLSVAGYRLVDAVRIGTGPEVALAGDYNGDEKVDAADYVLWCKDPLAHGGDPGGYNMWRANFGSPPGSGSGLGGDSTVPEPSVAILLVAVGIGATCLTRRFERSISD